MLRSASSACASSSFTESTSRLSRGRSTSPRLNSRAPARGFGAHCPKPRSLARRKSSRIRLSLSARRSARTPRTSARSAAAGCQAVHCTRRWGAWRGMHGSSASACPVAAATWPMDSGFPAHVCFASHFLVPLLGLNCRTARVRRGTGVLWSTDLPANPAAKASFAWRRTRTTDP